MENEVTKQQALDVLESLKNDWYIYNIDGCLSILKRFIESVDSVELSGIKQTFLDTFDKLFTCNDDSGGKYASVIMDKTHDMLFDGIPGTLNTSCQYDELEKQTDRLAKFIMSNVDGEPSQSEGAIDCAIRIISELQSQLESERAAHAETRAKLDAMTAKQEKPVPVAPAEWEPVFARIRLDPNKTDYSTHRCFSLGRFEMKGTQLIVLFGATRVSVNHWCCVNNREHHSEGWKPEWEKE